MCRCKRLDYNKKSKREREKDERKRAQDQSFLLSFLTIFLLCSFFKSKSINIFNACCFYIFFFIHSFMSYLPSCTSSLLPHGAFVYYKISYCHCFSILTQIQRLRIYLVPIVLSRLKEWTTKREKSIRDSPGGGMAW